MHTMRATPPQPSGRQQARSGSPAFAGLCAGTGGPHQLRPLPAMPLRPGASTSRWSCLTAAQVLRSRPWWPCLTAAQVLRSTLRWPSLTVALALRSTPRWSCLTAAPVLLMWGPAPAAADSPPAQTGAELVLYRCGAQGRELRNTPCPAETGASQVLHFDPDDADAARQARERVHQESLQLDRTRREREAQARAEQRAPRGALINARPPPPTASAAAPVAGPSHRTARSRPGKQHQAPSHHAQQQDKGRRDATPPAPGTKADER